MFDGRSERLENIPVFIEFVFLAKEKINVAQGSINI